MGVLEKSPLYPVLYENHVRAGGLLNYCDVRSHIGILTEFAALSNYLFKNAAMRPSKIARIVLIKQNAKNATKRYLRYFMLFMIEALRERQYRLR